MKLLILTQKVSKSDPVFGFFFVWLCEFAKQCESLIVICLERGDGNLPDNVKVLSLGKEGGLSKIKYVFNSFRFISKYRKEYDGVFVHMNQVYVLLGGAIWRMWGKKVALWYNHRQKTFSLYIAEKLVGRIFTVTKDGFKIKSNKITITETHGVDVENFNIYFRERDFIDPIKITSVGRITKIKNLDILIDAISDLNQMNVDCELDLIGNPVNLEDKKYKDFLEGKIRNMDLISKIRFVGPIDFHKLPEFESKYDISVNLCPTGGLDKAVIEGMALGMPVFVSNRAFEKYFGRYKDRLIFEERNSEDLANKIKDLLRSEDKEDLINYLTNSAMDNFSTHKLVSRIIDFYGSSK